MEKRVFLEDYTLFEEFLQVRLEEVHSAVYEMLKVLTNQHLDTPEGEEADDYPMDMTHIGDLIAAAEDVLKDEPKLMVCYPCWVDEDDAEDADDLIPCYKHSDCQKANCPAKSIILQGGIMDIYCTKSVIENGTEYYTKGKVYTVIKIHRGNYAIRHNHEDVGLISGDYFSEYFSLEIPKEALQTEEFYKVMLSEIEDAKEVLCGYCDKPETYCEGCPVFALYQDAQKAQEE